jgi:hypothetical protein
MTQPIAGWKEKKGAKDDFKVIGLGRPSVKMEKLQMEQVLGEDEDFQSI